MGMLGIILYMYVIIKPIETEYLFIPFGNITYQTYSSRWWFQIFFIFIPTWGRFPIWLIFFRWVETTNQSSHHSMISGKGLQWNRSFITSWWGILVWSWSLDVLFILLVSNMIYKYRQPNLALGEGDLYQWTTLLPDSFEEPKALPHVVLDGKLSNWTSYQLSKGKCQYPHSLQCFNVSPLVAEFCHQQHFGGSPAWRPRRALVGGIKGVDKITAHDHGHVCCVFFKELFFVGFEIQAASERLVLFPAERLNGTQQVILCLQCFSRERSRLQKMRPDTPKCACAQDHVQTTRVWWGGTLWVCICKASLAKACATICTKCFRSIPQKWPISSHQDGIWGCRPKVFRNWSKGAIEDDRTCCLRVFLPLIQYSSCFPIEPNICKQVTEFFWASFCLVTWYILQSWSSHIAFPCEASCNVHVKAVCCFWYLVSI